MPDWKRELKGRVVATGPGRPLYHGGHAPMQTEVGDRVTFGAAKGMEAVRNGRQLRILRDSDIDAVLE